MIRAIFLSIGLLVVVGGALCLLTNRVVLFPNEHAVSLLKKWDENDQQRPRLVDSFVATAVRIKVVEPRIEISPPKWSAWLAVILGTCVAAFSAARLIKFRPIG